jgi:hypothetical protein
LRPGEAIDIELTSAGELKGVTAPHKPSSFDSATGYEVLDLSLIASSDFVLMIQIARQVLAGGFVFMAENFGPNAEPYYDRALRSSGMEPKLRDLAEKAAAYLSLCDDPPIDPGTGRSQSPIDILATRHEVSRRTVQSWMADAERWGLMIRPGPRRRGGTLTPWGEAVLGADRASRETES